MQDCSIPLQKKPAMESFSELSDHALMKISEEEAVLLSPQTR